ncbi:MAG: hypothetical protein IJW14_01785 [Oscillospiraceae bacterium]|nr:hypothetical protein [Oscillospiraceae bacterium]
MRKTVCLLLAVLMSCLLAMPAMAAPEGPVITLQPQSPNYPHYSVAIYTVKAEGTNLQATWYMEWLGKTYTISDIGGAMEEWEAFAGESYGARKVDDNTFIFVFEGIERDLDGGYIWCVIEDGHYAVTSQKSRICVGSEKMPPEIVSIPTELTVEQSAEAEIRCVAKSLDDSELSFLWYETDTGRLGDIRAVNRGTETADYLLCDTSEVGTRNYICMVESANGGMTYSSVVSVTVTEKQPEQTQPQDPTEPTTTPTVPSEQPTVSTEGSTSETQAPTTTPDAPQQDELPWWTFLIVAVIAAGVGFGAAVIFVKKKK